MKKIFWYLLSVLAVMFLLVTACQNGSSNKEEPSDGNYWKVTFDLGYEGADPIEPVKILKGQEGGLEDAMPANPERPGYQFAGWYDDTLLFTAYFPVTKDTAVTARWNKTWIVTFDPDSQEAEVPSPITVRDGRTITLPGAPVKTGNTFLGWFAGETQYTNTTEIKEDVTLKAEWHNGYVVKFANVTPPIDDILVGLNNESMGDKFPQPPSGAEKFEFDKWVDQEDGETEYTASTVIAKSLTLIPQYRKGEGVEYVTTTGTAAPVYVFKIPEGKKLGDYTGVSIRILSSSSTSGRLRMWGAFCEEDWADDEENWPDGEADWDSNRGTRFGNNNAPDNSLISTKYSGFNQTTPWVWQKYDIEFTGNRDNRYTAIEYKRVSGKRPFDNGQDPFISEDWTTEVYRVNWDANSTGTIIFAVGIISQAGSANSRSYYITDVQLYNAVETLPCEPAADFRDGNAFVGYLTGGVTREQ